MPTLLVGEVFLVDDRCTRAKANAASLCSSLTPFDNYNHAAPFRWPECHSRYTRHLSCALHRS